MDGCDQLHESLHGVLCPKYGNAIQNLSERGGAGRAASANPGALLRGCLGFLGFLRAAAAADPERFKTVAPLVVGWFQKTGPGTWGHGFERSTVNASKRTRMRKPQSTESAPPPPPPLFLSSPPAPPKRASLLETFCNRSTSGPADSHHCGAAKESSSLTRNGIEQARGRAVATRWTEVRDHLDLTGNKEGLRSRPRRRIARCWWTGGGSMRVLRSPVMKDGAESRTIEGLAQDGALHPCKQPSTDT